MVATRERKIGGGPKKYLFAQYIHFIIFFLSLNVRTQKKILGIVPSDCLLAIIEAIYNIGLKTVPVKVKLNKKQKRLLNRVIYPNSSVEQRRKLLQTGSGMLTPLLSQTLNHIHNYDGGERGKGGVERTPEKV